jgi:hypothetical protein
MRSFTVAGAFRIDSFDLALIARLESDDAVALDRSKPRELTRGETPKKTMKIFANRDFLLS